MKKLFSLLLTLAILSTSFAQKDGGNPFKKGTDEYKMFMAKQAFFGEDYRTALNKYKEVEKNRPNDASVHFYIGQCYYMMNTYQDAIDELEKAKSIDPKANSELSIVLGKSYHAKGMIDKALEEYNTYRKSIADSPKKIAETEIDIFISQCNNAKQLMAKPVNVKFTQLLDLNSQYDDKGPVLMNNDKTLIITSRRPMGDKSVVDVEGDYGYKDDVYESFWNDEKRTWSSAELMRGQINLDHTYDACTSISADGTMMFIYRNGGDAHGGEILLSKKATSGKWKTPEILLKPINTSYYEDAACISPDGNTLYFVSERPGGLGRNCDIYYSKKTAEGWGEPVNIGAPVNTPYDENGLYLTPDGKTLFYCSDGAGSMGSYDIFRTTMWADGKWSAPVNLGYPINSVGKDSKFVFSADKKTAYIATVRDSGLGERDVYMVDISNYDPFTGVSTMPAPKPCTLMGKVTSSDSTHAGLSVEIKIIDKSTGAQTASTKSAADGSYSVEFSGGKPVLIEITADGYQKFSEEISFPAGKSASKDIVLPKNN